LTKLPPRVWFTFFIHNGLSSISKQIVLSLRCPRPFLGSRDTNVKLDSMRWFSHRRSRHPRAARNGIVCCCVLRTA